MDRSPLRTADRGAIPRMRRVLVASAAIPMAAGVIAAGPVAAEGPPPARLPIVAVSSDPFHGDGAQHATELEPDSFSYGSTIVTAFQQGRFATGGSEDIGWATSSDAGRHWSHGSLPGIASGAGAAYDRVSDASVAFDAAHNVWLIGSLGITALDNNSFDVSGTSVLVNRSTDGGHTWQGAQAVTQSPFGSLDKDWVACDDSTTSSYYGTCYATWDDYGAGDVIMMSTSTDGGLTWSTGAAVTGEGGLGGQPVVLPNGTVVVPAEGNSGDILAFRSTDGGQSWSPEAPVAAVSSAEVGGNMRTEPLPSAEVDGAGRIYVVWQDCRFRRHCASNDIVMSNSTDGLSWTKPTRIPIDAVTSGRDHFIPGIGVDPTTSGVTAHLAVAYYSDTKANCTEKTCQLMAGIIRSFDGGKTWTDPQTLAGPMRTSWLPTTTLGRMAGDYISTSFADGRAFPIFAVAHSRPRGTSLNQTIDTALGGVGF